MPCPYISDGYTRDAYVAAVRSLYPEVRFTYRPLLAQGRSVLFHQMSLAQPDEAERIAAEALSRQLVSWTLCDEADRTVDITVPNMLRVEPNLLLRLFQIVAGRELTDEDPRWTQDACAERLRERQARVFEGRPAEERERAAVGNSAAGCD